MERAAGLLDIFYNGSSRPAAERQRAHADLVALLRDPSTADSAAQFVQTVGGSLSSGDVSSVNAVVLHYALHALEERARSAAFSSLPKAAVRTTIDLLVGFVVSSYAYNARRGAGSPAVPQHVVAKGARAAVSFGRREWAAEGNGEAGFPRTVLGLVNQNGHSADSLPRMFGGITLLTVLVDDALDDPRANMLAGESKALRQNLKMCSSDILAALEVGLRIAGPSLPESVPVAAARSVASIARVHPAVAPQASAMLRRCVVGRADPVTVEMLSVLADMFADSSAPLNRDVCRDALGHVAGLMEAVAMGEAATGEDETVCLYRLRVVAYAEAVTRRVVGLGASVDALERLFNGLMGTTLRWAKDCPDQFPAALDAWMGIFETFDDCEVEMSSPLLQKVLSALSQLCVQRCMFSSNATVLRNLDDDDDVHDDAVDAVNPSSHPGFHPETVKTILAWDDVAEKLGTDSANVSTTLMELALHADSPDGATVGGLEGDGLSTIPRSLYVSKSVDTLVTLAQASEESVGQSSVQFAGKILSQVGMSPAYNSQRNEYLDDLITATNIAYAVAQLLPPASPATRALLEAVVGQLQGALRNPGETRPDAMFALLRTAAFLTRSLQVKPDEALDPKSRSLAEALSTTAVGVLQLKSPMRVSTAAAFVLLLLNKTCGTSLFPTEPPFGVAFAPHNQHVRPVCALGATGIVDWTLGLHDASRAGTVRARRWSEEEKAERTKKFSQGCFLIFKEFVEACRELKAVVKPAQLVEIARGAALLRTVVTRVMEQPGHMKDVVWAGIGRDVSSYCLEALVELKRHCSTAGGNLQSRIEEEQKCLFAVMSCLVGAVGCILRGCRRQARVERPMLGTQTIQLCMEIVQGLGSARLARVLLKLLLDQLVSGGGPDQAALIKAAVDLAGRALSDSDDGDLGQTAVKVLAEVMSRFWLRFWPNDVAYSALGQPDGAAAHGGQVEKETYFGALRGILAAVGSKDLETCQAGLLSLETLNASRKLYAREEAFRACGAAEQALTAALGVLGAADDAGRKSLADEADSVVWGIASADLGVFYRNALPKIAVEVGKCSVEDAQALCNSFGNAQDRPSFLTALHAMANDLAFLHARRSSPAL